MFTGVSSLKGVSTMCPNCFNTIAMAMGGAGSTLLVAAAGLGFRTARALRLTESSIEETAS
jgi:hypothetical protein